MLGSSTIDKQNTLIFAVVLSPERQYTFVFECYSYLNYCIVYDKKCHGRACQLIFGADCIGYGIQTVNRKIKDM